MKKGKAIVLFSGGVDSTLALAWAIHEGYQPTVLEFDYEGRPEAEKEAAHRILRRLGSPTHVRLALGTSLRPEGETGGYLASRNLLLHSAAQSTAETIGAEAIIAGHLSDDADQFPDAKPRYIDAIVKLAQLARPNLRPIPVELPLHGTTRAARRRLAAELGAPVDLAWSCWEDRVAPCGRCEKCKERARFDDA